MNDRIENPKTHLDGSSCHMDKKGLASSILRAHSDGNWATLKINVGTGRNLGKSAPNGDSRTYSSQATNPMG